MPHTSGPRFPDSASQPAPLIAAAAFESYDKDDDVILMSHPDVSAASSRSVTPVVANQLFPRVIVQVPVPQTPNFWASTTAAFPKQPIVTMQSAVVVLVESTRFTFKVNDAPVDIARHVLVQTDCETGELANQHPDANSFQLAKLSVNLPSARIAASNEEVLRAVAFPARQPEGKILGWLRSGVYIRSPETHDTSQQICRCWTLCPSAKQCAQNRRHDLKSFFVATGATERTLETDTVNARFV